MLNFSIDKAKVMIRLLSISKLLTYRDIAHVTSGYDSH